MFRGQPYSRSKIIVIVDMRFEYATSVFVAKANATNPNKVGPVLFGRHVKPGPLSSALERDF